MGRLKAALLVHVVHKIDSTNRLFLLLSASSVLRNQRKCFHKSIQCIAMLVSLYCDSSISTIANIVIAVTVDLFQKICAFVNWNVHYLQGREVGCVCMWGRGGGSSLGYTCWGGPLQYKAVFHIEHRKSASFSFNSGYDHLQHYPFEGSTIRAHPKILYDREYKTLLPNQITLQLWFCHTRQLRYQGSLGHVMWPNKTWKDMRKLIHPMVILT